MREVKFRGKRIDNGKWTYGDLIQLLGEQGRGRKFIVDNRFGACIDTNGDFLNTEAPFVNEVDPETVGQHTGLKDKNGKEIYEGDILTSPEYPYQDDGKYNYHGVIEWIDEEASFYMTKRLANPEKRGTLNGISQPIESIEEFEVIGNIYENPELLEVNHE